MAPNVGKGEKPPVIKTRNSFADMQAGLYALNIFEKIGNDALYEVANLPSKTFDAIAQKALELNKELKKGYGDAKKTIGNYKLMKDIKDLAYKAKSEIINLEMYKQNSSNKAFHTPELAEDLNDDKLTYLKKITDFLTAKSEYFTNLAKSGKYKVDNSLQQVEYKEGEGRGGAQPDYKQATSGKDAAKAGGQEGGQKYNQDKKKKELEGAKVAMALMFVVSLSFLSLSVFNGARDAQLVDSLGTTGMFILPSNFYGDAIWNVYTDSIGLVYVMVSFAILAVFAMGRVLKQW